MADSVRITIEADDKTAAGITSAITNLTKLESAAQKTKGAPGTGGGGSGVAGLSGAFNTLNGALGAIGLPAIGATAVLGGIVAVTKKAYNATMDYGAEVRDLSLITKTGSEKTSRLLQVLDDYEISAQDAEIATKALTKNGYVPTVETLAELSDQYLKLNDAQAQNEFILKNLGKGGLQWVNFLNQGSAAILEANKNVNKNLILSEEQNKSIERQRLRVDEATDTIKGWGISAVANFLESGDAANEFAKTQDRIFDAGAKIVDQYWEGSRANASYSDEVKRRGAEVERATIYGLAWEKALAKQSATAEGASLDYAALLKGGVALTKNQQEYTKTTEDLNTKLNEQLAIMDKYGSRYGETSKKYIEAKANAEVLQTAIGNLETAQDLQGAAYVSSLLQQQEGTEKLGYDFAVATGQMTKSAADQAKAYDKVAKALANGKLTADQAADAVKTISGDVASLNGMSAEAYIDVYITTHGEVPILATDVTQTKENARGGGKGGGRGFATGTSNAGVGLFAVGEGGEEGLRVGPDGRVSVIPNRTWMEMKKYGVQPHGGFMIGGQDITHVANTSGSSYTRGSTLFSSKILGTSPQDSGQQISAMVQTVQTLTQTVATLQAQINKSVASVAMVGIDPSSQRGLAKLIGTEVSKVVG